MPGLACRRNRLARRRPQPRVGGPISLDDRDDLPLHSVTIRWIAEYARAADGEQDGVVGELLAELNALLLRAGAPEHGRASPPASNTV